MKARIFSFVLLICSIAYIEPQGIDVVVMVDTSESMFPFFDDLQQYLLKDILATKLNRNDTFHLLSFDTTPRTELEAVIEDDDTLNSLARRLQLLYPLGQYTDLVAAVETLLGYVQALPEQNSKLVLLLTDGVHDPPPGSPNSMSSQEVRDTLLASARLIRRQGWSVHILQMPAAAAAAGKGVDKPSEEGALEEFAAELGAEVHIYDQEEKETLSARLTGIPTVTFPQPLGEVGRRFRARFMVSNPGRNDLSFRVVGLEGESGNLLVRNVRVSAGPNQSAEFYLLLRLPADFPAGDHSLLLELLTADPPTRLSPSRGEVSFRYPGSGTVSLLWLFIILGALVLIVLARLLILLIRKLQELSFAGVFSATAVADARSAAARRPLIMRVIMQNSRIGSRNIHRVPRGATRSVGGDGSHFLIYYLPMPRRIGDVKNVDDSYSFIPRKVEYFPQLKGPLSDCLGRRIEVLSKHGHTVTFYFEKYISPLEEINELMRSIKPHEPEDPEAEQRED
jgi:hypothetical protein